MPLTLTVSSRTGPYEIAARAGDLRRERNARDPFDLPVALAAYPCPAGMIQLTSGAAHRLEHATDIVDGSNYPAEPVRMLAGLRREGQAGVPFFSFSFFFFFSQP
jgi:hypothetical protein